MADLRVVAGNRNAAGAKRNARSCLCAKPDIARLAHRTGSADNGTTRLLAYGYALCEPRGDPLSSRH
jgi:hypothetical protein